MISIIIPTFNEEENIQALVLFLTAHGGDYVQEIIVADGGSADNTLQLASAAGARAVTSPQKGRAAQMNFGASLATGDILYFVHADIFPPASFAKNIHDAVQNGFDFGRYRTEFNSKKCILKLNGFFTRFDLFVCYGGDQTLFITRLLFDKIEGFDSHMMIMEDYDIVVRAKAYGRYKILAQNVRVSARKYDTNSWWQVQRANYIIVQMFRKGASQEAMGKRYKELLSYR